MFLFSLCSSESERRKKGSEKSRDFTASFMALLCSIIILLSLKSLRTFYSFLIIILIKYISLSFYLLIDCIDFMNHFNMFFVSGCLESKLGISRILLRTVFQKKKSFNLSPLVGYMCLTSFFFFFFAFSDAIRLMFDFTFFLMPSD